MIPELELREATDEGAELIGALGGEDGTIGGWEIVDLRINLRREKADEEVENVDP